MCEVYTISFLVCAVNLNKIIQSKINEINNKHINKQFKLYICTFRYVPM